MKPTFTNIDTKLSGRLIILEGPDGSGKSTQASRLKKELLKQGHQVLVSEWKSGKYFSDFFESIQEPGGKRRLEPTSNLMLQAADLLYRLEKKIIPALRKGKTVILDRCVETIYVRGYSIGLTKSQIDVGILGTFHKLYGGLIDSADTIYFQIDTSESLKRLQKRLDPSKQKLTEGTLINLHMVSNLTYSDTGEKLTLKKKRKMVEMIQRNMIRQYDQLFSDSERAHVIDASQSKSDMLDAISNSLQIK